MFKAIFCNENNRDLLKRLIEEVINESIEIIELRVPELIKNNIIIKNKTLDVLVRTDKEEINIEVNSYSNNLLRRRNASYIFKRYSDSLNVGSSYSQMPKFIQINLTSNLNKLPLTRKYMLYNKDDFQTYIDNLEIYEINLKKAVALCYNKGKSSILGMLDMDYQELANLKGDDIMDKLKNEALRLNSDDDFYKILSEEEEDKLFINTIKEQGIEQGIEQNNLEIAKKMLSEDLDKELISKITNLSLQEIEKLQ